MHVTSLHRQAPLVILLDALHSIAAGSERQIYQLIQGLVAQGIVVRLVLLRHTPFSRNLTTFPCPIESLDITQLKSFHCITAMRGLRKRLDAEACPCVHAWLPESCLLAPMFLKTPERKIVTSRRDMGLIYRGKPSWLYRLMAHRTDCVIGNSQAVVDYASAKEHLAHHQTQVIYNGIELTTPGNPADAAPIFRSPQSLKLILVANIKPIKRQLDAVNACLALNDCGIDCELALIGEPQDKQYQQIILNTLSAHPAGNNISLPGSVKEPRQLLAQAHIGLLVSESEGLSNTLMEYMDAGLAIVATDTGGNPELISHGISGMLVPVADTQTLTGAIKAYADDPALQQTTGRQARLTLESKFSQHRMVSAHMQLYGAPNNKSQAATC